MLELRQPMRARAERLTFFSVVMHRTTRVRLGDHHARADVVRDVHQGVLADHALRLAATSCNLVLFADTDRFLLLHGGVSRLFVCDSGEISSDRNQAYNETNYDHARVTIHGSDLR